MRCLQMVEIRDLREGDQLFVDEPEFVTAHNPDWSKTIYWWAGSTFYIRVWASGKGAFDLAVEGDPHTKIGVWR